MLKDVKKTSEMENDFRKNPMLMIDYAYEAITENIILTEAMKEIFDRNTHLIEKIPVGEVLKKINMFLELDIFSTNFKIIEGLKIWRVVQHYSDEAVRQTRIIQ